MKKKKVLASGEHILDVKRSPLDERDYIAEAILPPLTIEKLPNEYDLRPQLLHVRDQGQEGACLAFAVTCMKEWEEKKNIGLLEYLSPQFVYDNRSNQDSAGMYPRDGMKVLQKLGVCVERFHPYGKSRKPDKITKKAKEDAANFKISGYAQIHSIEGLKKALMKQGPCLVAFPVYNFTTRFWKAEQNAKLLGGHAVSIVGWTKKGFIVRNSWGSSWGDQGYTIYPFEDFGCHWELWSSIDDETSKPFEYYKLQSDSKVKMLFTAIKDKILHLANKNKVILMMLGAFIVATVVFLIIGV